MKKWFAVIGDPIAQSKSPEMHNAWYEEMNVEKAVSCFFSINLSPEFISTFRWDNGYGLIGSDENIAEHISEPWAAKEIAKNTIMLPQDLRS